MDEESFPKEGLIKNEEMAIKIAESYWHGIYGDSFYNYVPFIAYKITDTVWQVTNVTPPTQLGGYLILDINSITGQVYSMGQGK